MSNGWWDQDPKSFKYNYSSYWLSLWEMCESEGRKVGDEVVSYFKNYEEVVGEPLEISDRSNHELYMRSCWGNMAESIRAIQVVSAMTKARLVSQFTAKSVFEDCISSHKTFRRYYAMKELNSFSISDLYHMPVHYLILRIKELAPKEQDQGVRDEMDKFLSQFKGFEPEETK